MDNDDDVSMDTRYSSLASQQPALQQDTPIVVPGSVIISNLPRQLPTELAYYCISKHPPSLPIVWPNMAHGDENTTTNPQQRETKDRDTDDNKEAAAVPSAHASHYT